MTGSPLIDVLISIIGIAMLVGLSYILGQAKTAKLCTGEQAAKRFCLDEPDFEAGEWVLDDKGLSALARSRDGSEFALLRVNGDKFSTRRLPIFNISAAYHAPVLCLSLADSTWPEFTLTMPPDRLQNPSLQALLTSDKRPS